ncbi:MAG: hypothetical protein J1E06_06000 [Acutalibacter sp.]|nr:hypothetical protein [Acutalibacter sp.]
MKKRMLSFALCGIFLLSAMLFAACSGDNGSPNSDAGTEIRDESLTDGEVKVIHLLTDLGHNAMRDHASYDQPNAQYVMDQFLADMGKLPEGYRLEVEVMPVEEADFQSRLTRLRTEIMSGRGPDIFFLSSADSAPYYRQERVFPNTKKAMEDGFFLPLDNYMETVQFMEFSDMNPVIMDAGCTRDGRFVLPVRYTFNTIKVLEPVTDTEIGWFDVVNGTDEVMANSYALATSWMFYTIFEDTVDTESKTLTFTEDELYNAVAAGLSFFGPWGTDRPMEDIIEVAPVDFSTDIYSCWDPEWKDIATYLPMRNREGGVTATVTSYIAINKNTSYPDEAFYVADLMMSKKFQSGQKSWESGYHASTSSSAVFSYSRGVSVYDDFLQEIRPMNYVNYIDDEMWPKYCELRDKITNARIMNNIDQALYDLYDYARTKSMTPGDELKKYVKQEYSKLVLMAGEL